MDNTWLIFIGLLLIIFELLFGVISGFDIALIGLSLIVGGFVHYYSQSWQAGIIASIIIILFYFAYFRKFAKRKLLLKTQKIGIDSLLGKTAIVIDPITKHQAGKVLLDGEVWRAVSKQSYKANSEVLVEKIEGVTLIVSNIEKL